MPELKYFVWILAFLGEGEGRTVEGRRLERLRGRARTFGRLECLIYKVVCHSKNA